MNGKLARTTSRREVSGAQIVQSINRQDSKASPETATGRCRFTFRVWRSRIRFLEQRVADLLECGRGYLAAAASPLSPPVSG